MIYKVTIAGQDYPVEIERRGDHQWRCRVAGREQELQLARPGDDVISILLNGASYEVVRERSGTSLQVWVKGQRFPVEITDPRSFRGRRTSTSTAEGPRRLMALMPGKVVRILRRANEAVEAGEGVLVVEAMKMQNEVKSPKAGVVRQVLVREGSAVNQGDVLAVVE